MNMKKKMMTLATLCGGMLLAMVSCTSENEQADDDSGKFLVSMLQDRKPVPLTTEQKVFAADNNGFTLRFLKAVGTRSEKSFVCSPLSISYVLGMVNAAAAGTTEQELEQTLGFHQGGIQAVNDYCKLLIERLPLVDSDVSLNIANAIYVNKHLATLKQQYRKDMADYYHAEAEDADFTDADMPRRINDWCSRQTNGMIKEIVEQIDPNTMACLLNAIYFKADWTSKFDKKNTLDEDFTTSRGERRRLPMMHQNVLVNYRANDTYAAVEMPYGNGMWAMTVLLPTDGHTTDDVIAKMTTDEADIWANGTNGYFSPYEVDLKLPRYDTQTDTDDLPNGLIGVLKGLGISRAFDSDFSEIPNMCEQSSVYISMMRQKAKIEVSEEGTKAAAVTVAGVNATTSANPVYSKATFHANHPFVYVIREYSTGVILFVGKYEG